MLITTLSLRVLKILTLLVDWRVDHECVVVAELSSSLPGHHSPAVGLDAVLGQVDGLPLVEVRFVGSLHFPGLDQVLNDLLERS